MVFLVFLGPIPLNAVFALLGPITYRGLSLVEQGLLGLAGFRRPIWPLRRESASSSALAWLLFLLQSVLWLSGRMSSVLACLLAPLTNRLRPARTAPAPPQGGAQNQRPRAAPTDANGRREQPRGEGEASVGVVHRLPLEPFRTEEDLRGMTSGELKQLLLEARRLAERAAAKSRRPQQPQHPGQGGAATTTKSSATGGACGGAGGWGGAGAKAPIPLERGEIIAELLELRGGSSGAQCAVCLCAYESGDPLRVLPCGHRFHVECIDSWLMRRSAACPFCSVRVDG